MITDVLLEKLELFPSPRWSKTLRPSLHATQMSNDNTITYASMGYLPAVHYSISNTPVTLSQAAVIDDLLSRAGERPFLVKDPVDFKAYAQPQWSLPGSFRVGLISRMSSTFLNPTVLKLYGVATPAMRDTQDEFESALFLRPIFYIEDGLVNIDGSLVPFTLDPVTRLVSIDGEPCVPAADVLSSTESDRYPSVPGAVDATLFYGAEFTHYTPMKVEGDYSLVEIDPGRSALPAVGAGRDCFTHYFSVSLIEVIPQKDIVLRFNSDELVNSI
jgi:hypothetical protein